MCVVANVVSKMLTQQIAESAQESTVCQRMLVDQLLADDYVCDVVIDKVLQASAQRVVEGHGTALSEHVEAENEFVSVALMLHDIFAFAPSPRAALI